MGIINLGAARAAHRPPRRKLARGWPSAADRIRSSIVAQSPDVGYIAGGNARPDAMGGEYADDIDDARSRLALREGTVVVARLVARVRLDGGMWKSGCAGVVVSDPLLRS